MEDVNVLDIVIVGIITLSGLFAFCRGFLSEMLGLGSWVIAGTGGVYLLPYVTPVTEKYIRNETLANVAAGVLSSLILLVVLTMVCAFITGRIRQSCLNRLDRVLGFFFGCLRGVIILMLMYFLLFVLSPKTLEDLSEDSKLYPYLDDVCMRVKGHMPESLFDNPSNEDDEESEKKKKTKDINELESMLKAIGKNEIELALEEIKDLPEDDPLRQMLEEESKNQAKSGISAFFEKLTGGDDGDVKDKKEAKKKTKKKKSKSKKKNVEKEKSDDDLFERLNGMEVESKNKKDDSLYGEKDKEDLNRLILENIEEIQ